MSDHDEIRKLQLEYAARIDTDDGDHFAELFMPDGILVVSTGHQFQGRETLSALVKATPRGGFHAAGDITEIKITGDIATGGCLYEAKRAGQHVFGYYVDRYQRTPEGWRFVHRKATARRTLPLNDK